MFFRCGSIKKKCAILEKKKSPENRQWWGWWPSARLPSPGLSSLNTVWPARLFLYSPSLFSTMGPVVERKHLQHTHRHVDCCCLFSRRNQISQRHQHFYMKNFSPLLFWKRDRKNILENWNFFRPFSAAESETAQGPFQWRFKWQKKKTLGILEIEEPSKI